MTASEISKDLIISAGRMRQNGGQQVGCTYPEVTVELPNVIRISCNIHRSQIRNKNLAIQLITIAIED